MRTILYYFLGFFAITMGVLWGFHIYFKRVLDSYFGEGFYMGLLSAFVENFIFFGTIGLIAQFVSMKSPEDQNFERRIEAVANASFINPKAKEFLISENRKLLAFNQYADIKLVIKEVDEQNKAFKIYTEFNNAIVNMCRDIEYSLVDTPAKAEAEIFINKIGGEVTHLSLTDENLRSRRTIIEGEVVALKEGQPSYNYTMPDFIVSANSRAIWKFAFWLWGSMDSKKEIPNNWYYVGVLRFTSDFRIKIKNETNYKITYDFKYPQNGENETKIIEIANNELAPGGDAQIKSGIMFNPRDRFQLFFNTFVMVKQ